MKPQSLSVLFFSHSAQLAGAERSLLELVEQLIADHGAVCTVVLPSEGPLKTRLEAAGAATLVIDYQWWCDPDLLPPEEARRRLSNSFKNVLSRLPELGKINPDVVFTSTLVIPWGAVAASFLGRPHIWSIREFGELDHSLKFYLPFPDVLNVIKAPSNLILTNSHAVKQALFGEAPPENVLTIYPHIDIPAEALREDEPDYFTRPQATRLIIFGTIHENKGQKDAILAVRELVGRKQDVELVIMGYASHPYLEKLKEMVNTEGLEPYVKFIDFRENPYPAVKQADIVLVCSRYEALGRVTIEAMLLGKPVIGTNTGGTPELVKAGFNGLLYTPGDYIQLADKIAYLIEHKAKIKEYGENGYKFAKENFTREKSGDAVARLLHEIKGKSNPSTNDFARFTSQAMLATLFDFTTAIQAKDNQINELTNAIQTKDNQINELNHTLQAKDNQIAELTNAIQIKDSQINELTNNLQAKDAQLQQINSGIVTQLGSRYLRIVDKLLRPGTRRRGIYELGLAGIRVILNEGWRSFWNKLYLWLRQKVKGGQQSSQWLQFNPSLSKKDARKIRFPQSSPNPEVSIIIPVYNKLVYTLNCLQSISQNTEGDCEVIVVDDASKDGTYRALSKIENLRLLKNKRNIGFIDSCNSGAKASKGKYILFLNNDTMVTKGWLPPLLEIIKRDDVGAVGSKLVYPDGTLQEAGSIVWNDGSALGYGRGDNAEKPEYNYVRDVDYCSGAALMVKRELFEKIGGFDERFKPGYYEDTDLCFSIRNLGYKVMYQPMSVVAHYEGTTCGTDIHAGIKKYQEINKPKFVEKWKTILDKHDPYNSCNNILSSRNRHDGKNILILDDRIPTPDQGSGYPRAYRLLKFVAELGYRVTFFPLENTTPWQPVTNELQQLGIEVFYGSNLDFTHFAENRSNYYDMILVSRPHNMEKAITAIKEFFPKAALIYDAEAIFSIREILKAKFKGSELKDEDAEHITTQELDLMKQADLIITVSENEKQLISEKAGLVNVAVWGHPVEVKEPKTPFDERRDIIFVGGFPYAGSPNEDAILYFTSEIFPTLRNKLSCRLFIVGANPPDSIKNLASSSIIVTGYVQDLQPYYESCRVFIVPHQYSAGIPWKLHEAMSYGIPCVISELTDWQLNLTDGKEAMVARDAEEFVEKIIKLYQDKNLWYAVQNHALNFVRQTCNPETMKNSLGTILEWGLRYSEEPQIEEMNMISRVEIKSLLPFSAHRIALAEDLWTISDGGEDPQYAPQTKALLEQAGGNLSGKRIIDLGCLEGGYTATFARMGAEKAVGIEARNLNFERCMLVKRCLKLDNLTFYKEDVKNITTEQFGKFDIVFASGILYHLDDPFTFLKNVYDLTLDFALIDTHVAHKDFYAHSCSKKLIQRTFNGNTYTGRVAFEYPEEKGRSGEIENLLWAAYSNPTSFWLTEESLVQMLKDIGFEHVVKVNTPQGYRCHEGCQYQCRIILIASR